LVGILEIQRLLNKQLSPKSPTPQPIVFDVETGGIYEGQNIYSYSMRSLREPIRGIPDTAIKSVYFDYRDPVKRENWSYFSNKAWDQLLLDKPNISFSTDSIQTTLKRDIVSHLNQGGVLVGHNLRFDLAAISQEMDPADLASLKKTFGLNDTDLFSRVSKTIEAENIIKNISALDKQGKRYNSYGKAYTRYIEEIASRMKAGQATIIDTQFMLQMAFGVAGEEKLIDFGKGGIDTFNATKLSYFNKLLTGEFGKHDESDVSANKVLFDYLTEFWHKYESKTLKGSQELDILYNAQKLQRYNAANSYHKSIQELVLSGFELDQQTGEYVFTNKFIRGTKKVPGAGTVPKGVPDYVDGLKETLEQHGSFRPDSIGSKKYGYTLSKAQTDATNLLDKIKLEIETAAQKGTGESANVYKKWMQSLLDDFTDEKVFNAASKEFKDVKYNPSARYELSHAFNTPGGKMLLGLAGVAMLSTAYIALSGGHESPPEIKQSRISSKDDDYNTIEGLHPGSGDKSMNRMMLQAITDFGSGWVGGLSKAFKNIEQIKAINSQNDEFIQLLNKSFASESKQIHHGVHELSIEGVKVNMSNIALGRTDEATKVFGSGWHGDGREDFSPYRGQNADLNPAYNKYKDEYKFNLFRASRVGLSEAEMYQEMTEEKGQGSEFSAASASAGTALHGYLQSLAASKGLAYGQEELVVNREHGVTGHIDIITQVGIGDIKTVNTGIFNTIKKTGKPKPMHYDQVQFYLGTTGTKQGYIQYVNRDNIQQQKFYTFDFDPYHYEKLMEKVEKTRSSVKEALMTGELMLWKMPKAASIESLENYQRTDHDSLEEAANKVDFYRGKFRQEMKYLRTVSRGMPNDQQAKNRIKEANDERRKQKIESAMVTTQGIMLQAFNNRTRHYIM